MKKVNVLTNNTYSTVAGRHELASLATGALAIFGENGVKLNFASLDLTSRLSWYVGGQVGVQEIEVANLKMSKELTQAAVNKVVKIGYNGSTGDLIAAAPFILGDYIGVSVHTVDYQDNEKPYRMYTVDLKTTDTIATGIDRLVAKINADSANTMVTALKLTTTGKVGIQFTGKSNRNFNISTNGLMTDDPIVESADYRVGFGLTALVQTEVDDNSAEIGDRYRKSEIDGYTKLVVPTTTYHCYTLKYTHSRKDAMQSFNQDALQTYRLYVPVGATTLLGYMDDIVTELG